MSKGSKDEKKDKKLQEENWSAREEIVPINVATQKAEKAAGQTLVEEEGWDAGTFLYRKLLIRDSPSRNDDFGLIYHLPESNAPPENYAKHWQALLEDKKGQDHQKILAILGKTLENKILIDLGGGKGERLRGDGVYEYAIYAPASMQAVAEHFKVRTYINVDRYHLQRGARSMSPNDVTRQMGIEQPEMMHVIYVEGDMLKFLSETPDQMSDVVLVLNGIDEFVIQNKRYHQALATEIARVLPSGGAILTCGSEDATKYLEKLGFEVAEGFSKNGWPAYPQLWIKK